MGDGAEKEEAVYYIKKFSDDRGGCHDPELPVDVSFGQTSQAILSGMTEESMQQFLHTRLCGVSFDKADLLDTVLCVHLWPAGRGRRKVRHDHILPDNVALPSDVDGFLM